MPASLLYAGAVGESDLVFLNKRIHFSDFQCVVLM